MKKILITAYFFWPEINPRAFRTYELAKELSKSGYEVDIIIPDIDYDYAELETIHKLNIYKIPSGYLLNQKAKLLKKDVVSSVKKKQVHLFLKNIIRRLFYCIFTGGKSIEYSFSLYRFLLKRNIRYDGIISIGLPISVHIASSLYISKNTYLRNHSIADYGDPFSLNTEMPSCFYYKFLEKYFLKNFRYITVPIVEAVKKFKSLKSLEQVKVIPQGYDFSNLTIAEDHQNLIPTFGYAGIFYQKIRNPKILFEFLVKIKIDFRFIIYTDITNPINMEMILPYITILKNKLILHNLIPREECIYELSKMNFVLNQNNLDKEQSPSKLIDYMLTKRPIFNYSQDKFNENEFLEFLEAKNIFDDNEIESYHSKLEEFKSANVTKKFLNLLELSN